MSESPPDRADAPRVAVILKVDTLGDLVIFAPVLCCLRTAWPQTRLVVVIRQACLSLAPLLAPGVEWLPTPLDSFADGPEANPTEVGRLRTALLALAPDLLAAATSRRNWLEVALAAAVPKARCVALGAAADDEFFATRLRVALGLDARQVFGAHIPLPADEPDWRRNFELADYWLGRAVARTPPSLTLEAGTRATVSGFMTQQGLIAGRYVVCAAAGFANVRLKTWPAERFAAALRHLQERHGLAVVLIGHESERDHLEAVAAGVVGRDAGTLPQPPPASLTASSPRATAPAGPLFVAASPAVSSPVAASLAATPPVPASPSVAVLTQRSPAAAAYGALPPTGASNVAASPVAPTAVAPAPGVARIAERPNVAHRTAALDGAAPCPLPARPTLWLGTEGSLPQLAALISQSALFLGNDTGAMHLAAALAVPVVAIFGGGTWPRFVPAARRGVAVVHPLPCFGCGWDCAFGDAPCLGLITAADVTGAIDHVLDQSGAWQIQAVDHLGSETREMMGRAAARYRATRTDHLARQHKLENLTALAREKDGEIHSLKAVCDEREKTIFILDAHVRNFQAENGAIKADKAVMEKTLAALPADAAKAAQTIADLVVHIRNIEALLKQRENEITERKTSEANRAAGLHDLEQAKRYGRLLAERDTAVQWLREALTAREDVIKRLMAETTGFTGVLHKLGIAVSGHIREKWWRPLDAWLFRRVVDNYWMQIGVLRHYAPRPLRWDERLPGPRLRDAALPQVAIVTPSYGQEKFIERTLRSVLDQGYPKLAYVVQDGASRDRSPEIIGGYAGRLHHWQSVKDDGQADAIQRGFAHLNGALGPHDIMAWLNSDDLLAPGSLRFVAEYFATHPNVDVVYGHRIIIDDEDREVGRWIMPRHNPKTLEWIDYVPQETMFWRKRAWDLTGGIDPSFQFALDWDLLARFHQADCRMARLPYFLGAFRVHAGQKTSHAIHTTGADEMRRIRTRFHGERQDSIETIHRHARHARFWGAITARLHEVGLRW